ncbi:MAG TPA: helix-turn-helix domain-containing protein, partial [Elainellaceae cyanobacterium]
MTGRSLSTSEQGIARAKRALLRKNLTQKAIANELGIASWSTVSKFFNGKPVDRLLFMEICHALDLDWTEVAATPDLDEEDEDNDDSPASSPTPAATGPSQNSDDLLSAVQKQAAIARDALTPRILERIPRDVVRQKYLPAIARGVDDGQPRIIPIIGAAGYGKSTILGDLYDELMASNTAWVGLILCSSVSVSTGFLSFVSYSLVASTFASTMGTGSPSSQPATSQEAVLAASFGENL